VNGSAAKGLFLAGLAIVATALVLIIYQVPQPWRGILVGWVLFLATGGWFILRFAKHLFEYKALRLSARQSERNIAMPHRNRALRNTNVGRLKVVVSDTATRGRHIIR
jgi:hypothetical protein